MEKTTGFSGLKKMAVMCAVAGLAAARAVAATWYVDAAVGVDTNDGTDWARAKRQIQAAVELTTSGDTIYVRPGVYNPISVDDDRVLTIESTGGARATIIDGGGSNRCALLGVDAENPYFHHAATLKGFTLSNGYAAFGGGASDGVLINCILSSNRASYAAAAASSKLYNCLITGNEASVMGSAACYALVYNCTVYGNSAPTQTSIMLGSLVHNSIVWGNGDAPVAATYINSCVEGLDEADGNISSNPLFMNAAAQDFRLLDGSSCRGTGDPIYAFGPAAADIDGTTMLEAGAINMGAFGGVVSAFTTQGVPYGWLAEQGIVVSGANGTDAAAYEAAALSDPVGKGYPAWHDYVAGTDPTDADSRFRATLDMSGGEAVVVGWAPDFRPDRVYTVLGTVSLVDAEWQPQAPVHRFFKVQVELPE